MAKLELHIPLGQVKSGAPFAGTVSVSGARPGATVHVSMRQVQGPGSWSDGTTVNADSQGAGLAAFPEIVLAGVIEGSVIATLLADASDDAGDFFWSDSKSVEVIA